MVKVEDFFYIPNKMDPSDPATRSKYSLADLGQGSEWQQPNFLFSPRRAWPISSDYPVSEELIPIEEFRANYFSTFQLPVVLPAAAQVALSGCPDFALLIQKAGDVMNSTNNYEKAVRIMAYVLRFHGLFLRDDSSHFLKI